MCLQRKLKEIFFFKSEMFILSCLMFMIIPFMYGTLLITTLFFCTTILYYNVLVFTVQVLLRLKSRNKKSASQVQILLEIVTLTFA